LAVNLIGVLSWKREEVLFGINSLQRFFFTILGEDHLFGRMESAGITLEEV